MKIKLLLVVLFSPIFLAQSMEFGNHYCIEQIRDPYELTRYCFGNPGGVVFMNINDQCSSFYDSHKIFCNDYHKIFKQNYKDFFSTLPKNATVIIRKTSIHPNPLFPIFSKILRCL